MFEPKLIGKHERFISGCDDKIIAMYARGMSVREIQGILAQMYSVDVSPDFISRVTDAVMEEVLLWQGRPLESMYPAVHLRCAAGQEPGPWYVTRRCSRGRFPTVELRRL